jgi:hypothetical protein
MFAATSRDVRVVAWMLCLLGCGPTYDGGLSSDGLGAPERNARRVGCVDVRVASLVDRAADPSSPVVAYDFGNRCRRPALVDLTRVRVVAGYGPATASVLRPFDPEGVIQPGLLDGRGTGREVIAYLSPRGQLDPPAWFCVDVGRLSDGDLQPKTALCFDRDEEGSRWRSRD